MLFMTDHDDPFHNRAKGVPAAESRLVPPTAVHQVALTQSMPVASTNGGVPVALGVAAGTNTSEEPFHWLPNTTGVLPS
jgi:hypothetical protein